MMICSGITHRFSKETESEDLERNNNMSKMYKSELSIISNSICYGPEPKESDEVEQHLIIRSDGYVFCSRYAYGGGFGHYKRIGARRIYIDAQSALAVIEKGMELVSHPNMEWFATDIGEWNMVIISDKGKTYKMTGSLLSTDPLGKISDQIREMTGFSYLYVFDGNGINE